MQMLAEPVQDQTELFARGSEDGFGAIAPTVALLAVVGLEVVGHWLGGLRAKRRRRRVGRNIVRWSKPWFGSNDRNRNG